MRIDLPADPVDGYRVEAWYTDWDEPVKVTATYYVSQPFDEWAARHYHGMKGGAPIVDDWMVDGPWQSGRVRGWSAIVNVFGQAAYVATEDEALRVCIDRADGMAQSHEEQARQKRGLAWRLYRRRNPAPA